MLCFIFKWKISRSHDLGIPLSGLFASHIDRCKECRDFSQSLKSLSDGLRGAVQESLEIPNLSLDKKIKTVLAAKPVAPKIPRRGFRPAYNLAAALVVIFVAAFIFIQIIPERTSEPGDPFAIELLGSLDATDALQDVVVGLESSFEMEISHLEQNLKSTVQSMVYALNPEISDKKSDGS